MLGKPTEPRRPQPTSEPPALRPPVDLLCRLPARLVWGGLDCTTHPAPGATAPRGPVGVHSRARPRARSLAGTMMEEIDRFQVPTAHSEMQPLVRGRAANRQGQGRGNQALGAVRRGHLWMEPRKPRKRISEEGEAAGQENHGRIRGVTAKGPVRMEGTV